MQAKVVTKVTIAAAPAAVFKYLTDLNYHYLWNPQIQTFDPIIKLKKGSTYKTTSVVLGVKINATNEVTEFVPNKEIELLNQTGLVKYKVRFVLKPIAGKTEVTCDTDVSSESQAFAFATPVLKMLARRELQIDLQSLKLAVEHDLE